MMKQELTILLTGATGFIGSHLVPFLARRSRIITLGRNPLSSIPHLMGDLEDPTKLPDPSSIPRIDAVIHLAALMKKSNADLISADNYHRVNVEGTQRLLSTLYNKPLKHFLYISTCDVYAPSTNPINEESPVSGSDPYAASKLEAESLVQNWCNNRNITWTIIRLGNTYGPGEDGHSKFIPIAIKESLRRNPIPILGKGCAKRDFLYVADAAEALLYATMAHASGIYTCVSGQSYSVKQVAEEINRLTGNPAGLSLKDENYPEMHRIFSNTGFRSLGWSPKVGLTEGLMAEIIWFQNRLEKQPNLI